MKELEEKVYEIIKKVFNLTDQNIDKKFLKEGHIEAWDSLGHLNLLMELEREFNIKFSLDDIEKSRSFEDIVKLLEEKLNEGKN
jgi:acyl carrier protein